MPRSGWLAVGVVAGALAAPHLDVRVGAMAASAVAVLLLAARMPARAILPAALGAVAVSARLVLAGPAAPAAALPEGDGPWSARVESVGAPRRGEQVATIELLDSGARLAASLPRYPRIEPGLEVRVDGRPREPPDDDYGGYLRRTGSTGTIRSRSLEIAGRGEDAGARLEDLRRSSADALARALPEPEAGLAAGILIGLRDRVDREVAADFTTAGISHVVAISGWNIAIVAASVAALGGRLGRRRRTILTAVAITAYVAFAGASSSVLRAAAMAGVVLFARETGRAGRAAAALGWAAVVLLLADPALVGDAGFQLSTAATAGLLAWASPLTAAIDRATRGRLPGWMSENLGVSLAAQAATLPIVLASFGRLALLAPVVNLMVVPLVAPAMAAGAVALMAGWVVLGGRMPVLATLAGLPAWFLLAVVVRIADAAATVPFASIDLEPPLDGLTALGALGALVLAARGRTLKRAIRRVHGGRAARVVVGAVVAGAIALTISVAHRPDGRVRVTVLDVGQGDSILVEGGRGGRLLVDGGPDPDRLLRLLDERLPPWDRRIDVLVLTHPHEDHVAGLPLLLERYRVGRVFEPGMEGPGPGYAAWEAELAETGATSGRLSTGDGLWLDEIKLDVLWPDPGAVPSTPADGGTGINNVSIVLLGTVGERRFLLTGDVEEGIDPTLLARGLPRVDLLKVAHHGSRTASTEALLETVDPSVAIVSAGAGNRYGHPAPGTLERLMGTGAHVFRTDTDGTVVATIADEGVTVRTDGPRTAAAAPARAATAFVCALPPRSAAIGPSRATRRSRSRRRARRPSCRATR